MIGVNLAGAEFGSHRGVYGTDYTYPTASELDYYQGRGIDLIRLPFAWERMQPVLGSALDPAELGRMTSFLDAAAQRGMKVVIDLHNYGRYDGQVIGSSAVPIAEFQNFWMKLASALSDHPAIWGFGIMNEPHDMGGAQVWPAAAQAAVNGIRSTGSRETIIVSGDGWSGAQSWQQINAHLNVHDPLDNLMYEAHVYFDRGSAGVYAGGYDAEGAYPTIGVDRVQPFLDWLAANNFRGFIGEYGVPDNDPRWLVVLENFLHVLEEKDIPSAYWAGGPWWGTYPLSIEPRDGIDRPQMDVLERYTDNTVVGDGGDNRLLASAADSILFGYAGDDVLIGGAGSDTLWGGSDNDRLYGGTGQNDMAGGTGNDWYIVDSLTDVIIEAAGEGTLDRVFTALNYTLSAGAHVEIVSTTTTNTAAINLTGNELANTIYGNNNTNVLSGAGGNDLLVGLGGTDTLNGGAGNDRLDGGVGRDTASFAERDGCRHR